MCVRGLYFGGGQLSRLCAWTFNNKGHNNWDEGDLKILKYLKSIQFFVCVHSFELRSHLAESNGKKQRKMYKLSRIILFDTKIQPKSRKMAFYLLIILLTYLLSESVKKYINIYNKLCYSLFSMNS